MMDIIFSGFVSFFNVLVSFFPTANVSTVSQINEFTSNFRTGLSFVGAFIPLSVLLWGLSTILTIEIGILLFKTYRWIVANITLGHLG